MLRLKYRVEYRCIYIYNICLVICAMTKNTWNRSQTKRKIIRRKTTTIREEKEDEYK